MAARQPQAQPSPDDVAQQMNVVMKLTLDVAQSAGEMRDVERELRRRRDFLAGAREELGRMLKASNLLNEGEYRVIHVSEIDRVEAMFGRHRIVE